MKKSEKNGFTLLELIISIFMVFLAMFVIIGGIYGMLICGVAKGNFWVGETSALKAVQMVDNSATEVVMLERHVYDYCKATVKDSDGNKKTFYLDTNVLQNVSVVSSK